MMGTEAVTRCLGLRRRADDAGNGGPSLENVEAELILLREENARLKAERHRPSTAGGLVETLRGVTAASGAADDRGDDAWDVLTETMVIREVVLDVLEEVERCMLTLQKRLHSLDPRPLLVPVPDSAEKGNGNGQLPQREAAPANGRASLHTATPGLPEGGLEYLQGVGNA